MAWEEEVAERVSSKLLFVNMQNKPRNSYNIRINDTFLISAVQGRPIAFP